MKPRFLPFIVLACLVSSCHLLTPSDPPPVPEELQPDEVAWDKLDISRHLDFTGFARIDCPKVQSTLTASGKCLPQKRPFGAGIQCPLRSPASTFFFACLNAQDAPSVYFEMTWIQAQSIAFDAIFESCHLESYDVSTQPPRYPTDRGYRACIFAPHEFTRLPDARYAPENAKSFVSEIRKDPVFDRPVGIYIDLSQSSDDLNALETMAQSLTFSGTFSLIADGRFLDEEEKIQLLQNLFVLFKFYRDATAQTTTSAPNS